VATKVISETAWVPTTLGRGRRGGGDLKDLTGARPTTERGCSYKEVQQGRGCGGELPWPARQKPHCFIFFHRLSSYAEDAFSVCRLCSHA